MTRLAASLALVLTGCAAPSDRAARYEPVPFAELRGWPPVDPRPALRAFGRSCKQLTAAASLGRDWRAACAEAEELTVTAAADAPIIQGFFGRAFEPHRVIGPDGPNGLFTGYYEPELRAARSKRPGYEVPIYAPPPGSSEKLPARAEIESGIVAKDWTVLFWAADPVDVFTLHIQGSGRLALAEGGFTRIAFAGHNGYDYVAIGRIMRERHLLPPERSDMPAIRAWLRANPAAGLALMRENPRFIFFRELGDRGGPVGQSGVALTPMVSLAVDPRFIPLGALLWLDSNWPGAAARPLRTLTVAQDTGGAINGAVRGDLFWGTGESALAQAGIMSERGRYYLLLPRRIAGS